MPSSSAGAPSGQPIERTTADAVDDVGAAHAAVPRSAPRTALERFFERHERAAVIVLCGLAGLHVLAYSAGLPFFDNVDEKQHFDLVYKYSEGHVPRAVEPFSSGSAALIARYGSPEYLLPAGVVPPPTWARGDAERARALERSRAASWAAKLNHESTQPPLYYAVAGAWYRLGRALGLDGGRALYWIRFLNAAAWTLLVWASSRTLRRAFAHAPAIRAGVPLLLAVFPQQILYSINNDALSPVLFGLAFLGLVEIQLFAPASRRPYWATGLLAAAAFTVKVSNAAILGVLAAVLACRLRTLLPAGWRGFGIRRLALLAAAAILPVALWFAWNRLTVGDLTSSAGKLALLGWTPKPLGEIWHHPILSPAGAVRFWNGVMPTFWRGETVWHLTPLASPLLDTFFSWSSLAVVAVGAVIVWRAEARSAQRAVVAMALLGLALSLAFLAAVSMAYDFGDCPYPSRSSPFLVSGRLIAGMISPFVILFTCSVDATLAKLGLRRLTVPSLLAIAGVLACSEAWICAPVFQSPYNWFHLAG